VSVRGCPHGPLAELERCATCDADKATGDADLAAEIAAKIDALERRIQISKVVPPADQRPVCVLVAWLAEHPGHAARLQYLDHNTDPPDWVPASGAVHDVQPGWPVEVRLTPTEGAA